MTLNLNTPNLAYLAALQVELTSRIKELEAEKKSIRQKLLKFANDSYESKEYLLPQTSIAVPLHFFELTSINYEDFLSSRFPAWDLLSQSENDDEVVFTLRKKREYMPFGWEDESNKIARSISESTPEIDWSSLSLVEPDLFSEIVKETTVYQLDEERLSQIIAEKPEVVDIIKIHTNHTSPVIRVLASTKNG
jgi:hypothetical protein